MTPDTDKAAGRREPHGKIVSANIQRFGGLRWWWDCELCGIGGRCLLSEDRAKRGWAVHQSGWRHEYNLEQERRHVR